MSESLMQFIVFVGGLGATITLGFGFVLLIMPKKGEIPSRSEHIFSVVCAIILVALGITLIIALLLAYLAGYVGAS